MKWTRARDRRPARLISHIHCTSFFRQHCSVGNTALQCRLGWFQDSDFSRDHEDSNRLRWEFYAPSGVEHSLIGCARNKRQSHTVPLNLKLFLLMPVYAWMVFPLLISRTWLLKCCILLSTKQENPKRDGAGKPAA